MNHHREHSRLLAVIEAKNERIKELESLLAKDIQSQFKAGEKGKEWHAIRCAEIDAMISGAISERERCARLCEWLPYKTGLDGKTFAEAIRGVGIGGSLAKGFDESMKESQS